MLGGGKLNYSSNWPNGIHIECNINNDIPVKISSSPYVLLNRSVLCNCEIEAENYFLLAACQESESQLVMYFTVNLALRNYFSKGSKGSADVLAVVMILFSQHNAFLYQDTLFNLLLLLL